MVKFSNSVIEAMGFEPIAKDAQLSGRFSEIVIFQISGVRINSGTVIADAGKIFGFKYSFAVSDSINTACNHLLNDNYIDNESEWARERNATPPYLLATLGSTTLHTFEGTHAKQESDCIRTFDGFACARRELKSMSERVLPVIEASILCGFYQTGFPVSLRETDRAFVGQSADGQRINDIRITVNMRGIVLKALADDALKDAVATTVKMAGSINPESAKFLSRGSRLGNVTRKFLDLFLAIEIETNRAFDHSRAENSSGRIGGTFSDASTLESLAMFSIRDSLTNLAEKFLWCSVAYWDNLDAQDIKDFKTIKKIRNDLAHGSISEAKPTHVEIANRIALKLHRFK